jgi:hypothetical protein
MEFRMVGVFLFRDLSRLSSLSQSLLLIGWFVRFSLVLMPFYGNVRSLRAPCFSWCSEGFSSGYFS